MDNARLMRRWFDEVWTGRDVTVVDELMASDALAHGLVGADGAELVGTAGFKEFHRRFMEDFPELAIEVADVLADGDRCAARCIVRGKHGATGKLISFSGMTIVRWRDGKIAEAWNNFDFDVMRQQLV